MRILLHDFPGHPFQAELARSLGARGHEVLHVQCASFPSGKGRVDDDAPSSPTRFEAISLGETFDRYSTGRRLRQEAEYGFRFVRTVHRFRPDVLISSNDPLPSKALSALWLKGARARWIFWLQDIWSAAISRELAGVRWVGRPAGALVRGLERGLVRQADAVVQITPDFDATLDAWRVPTARRRVIENWAPLGELPLRPRDNAWAAAQGLSDRVRFVYAGTLGLKHNPDVLHALAKDQPDADVIVVSEGLGADRLRERHAEDPAPNLRVLPFQPWADMPDVVGSADVLVVLLEQEAGGFSVPSKVLTSLCAGRAILAAMPRSNLAARTIEGAQAGVVVDAGDQAAFLAAARGLSADPDRRRALGEQGRRHAEAAFDIEAITDRFEALIADAGRLERRRRRSQRDR